MAVLNGVWIVVLIVCAQAIPWTIIFYRMRLQAEAFRTESWRSGEMLILGPVRANYQGWNGRFGVTKTIGTLALLDRRLLFKRPLGPDISIPLDDISEVSDTVTLGSRKVSSVTYLSLKLSSGTCLMFIVSDAAKWIDAIRARLPSA